MSKNLNGGSFTQQLLLAVVAAGVVIIACILAYETWNKRRVARDAEVALQQLEKNRPERFVTSAPAEGESATAPWPVTVTIDDRGALRLFASGTGATEEVVNADQLRARLEQLIREDRGRSRDRTVVMKASPRLKYAELQKVIEAVKQAGAVPALETDGVK